MDFSIIQKLGKEPKYANQKNEYDVQFAPAAASTIKGESDEILTKTIVIHFFPNSWDLNKKVTKTVNGKEKEELYDPNVNFVDRGSRQARGPVRRGAHRDRRPYGFAR